MSKLSFPQKLCGCPAAKLPELTGAETKLLFECLAERGVTVVPRGKRHLGDIHRAHPQLARGALQAQTADIADGALADVGAEDAVEVGDGKARHRCQRLTVERLM